MIVMTDRVQCWNYTASFHYTHGSRRVSMQITLSARRDYDSPPTVPPDAIGVFTRIIAAGSEIDLLELYGLVPTFIAGDLTEINGLFKASNCYANGVINQFQWP
ncbi:MAG: hypothetical protein L0211_12880 [Planctomycetaceae bacterium]|nr:hypothetical protein [Planctomycetaceae bacterium]